PPLLSCSAAPPDSGGRRRPLSTNRRLAPPQVKPGGGIKPPRPLLPFPPHPGRRRGPERPNRPPPTSAGPLPCFPAWGEGEDRALCPKPPSFFRFCERNPHPFNLFPKKPFLFPLFCKQALQLKNPIINKPLHF